MNTLGSFLESSSIHGLSYISTSKKFFKFFWICIVFTGFSTAGLLINQAFQSWADSPVSTAIETRPISELTFPKVTVCPPINTFTDLNHELMMAENITIDEEDRKKLLYFAMDLLQDQLYEEFMFNLSIVHEENRYYNWYNGYTDIVLPRTNEMRDIFEYTITTFAKSGMVFTNFFGGKVYDKSYLNLYLRSQKSKDALFESICQNSSPSLPNFLLPPELHTVFPKRLLKLPFGSFFSCVYPLNLVWVHSILGLKYLWSKLAILT